MKTIIQDIPRTQLSVTNRMEFEYNLLIALRKFVAAHPEFGYIQGELENVYKFCKFEQKWRILSALHFRKMLNHHFTT